MKVQAHSTGVNIGITSRPITLSKLLVCPGHTWTCQHYMACMQLPGYSICSLCVLLSMHVLEQFYLFCVWYMKWTRKSQQFSTESPCHKSISAYTHNRLLLADSDQIIIRNCSPKKKIIFFHKCGIFLRKRRYFIKHHLAINTVQSTFEGCHYIQSIWFNV